MSYADLKPVKFDYVDSNAYQPQYQLASSIDQLPQTNIDGTTNNGPYYYTQENSISYYFTSYPTTNGTNGNNTDFSSTVINGSGGATELTRSSTPDSNFNENPERNNWMPMTWIEKSADNSGIYNFVCLWGACVEVTTTKESFLAHINNHLDEKEANPSNDFNCKVRGCEKKLLDIEALRKHMSMHLFQADCQQKGSEALIERQEFDNIEWCGFDPLLNIHYDGEVLLCQWDQCGTPFSELTDLFEHVSMHVDFLDNMDRVVQCYDSGDKSEGFQCKWASCSFFVTHKCNLKRHVRHHSGEKMLACPFCAKLFSRKDKLYEHVTRRTVCLDTPKGSLVCKQCQKTFVNEKQLCMHVSRHIASHVCPICGYAVNRRSDLHKHLVIRHSNRTKDHKCTVCQKTFYTEVELSSHSNVHSDHYYSCKVCNEKFKWKKQLMKHMKSHDENFNPSPFICHLCSRTYTTGYALGRHLTTKHSCPIPPGFSRFTYKKCEDGMFRLQTKRPIILSDPY